MDPRSTWAASEVLLLVEDEDAVRQLARTILEGRGFQVLERFYMGSSATWEDSVS